MKNQNIKDIEQLRKTDPSYSHIKSKINFSYKSYPDKFLYYYNVWKLTEQNSIHVPNIENRNQENHLDHIISIHIGYKYNILPLLIGSTENLRIIPKRNNLTKGSSITEDTIKVLSDFGIDLSVLEPNKIVKYTPTTSQPHITIKGLEVHNKSSLLYYETFNKKSVQN